MAWFTNDFNKFFKELAANNNKEWFDANRKRYEESVKRPMVAFTSEVIARTAALDPRVRIEPKDAIFRINRDIRFSKDKTPYKTSTSALVAPGGRKLMGPGLYFELGPEHIRVYGGQYMPDKETLESIRARIAKDPSAFGKLYSAKAFKELFGEVRGERNKVLPKVFKAAAEKEPLLYNKQFYYFSQLPASKATDPKLVDLFVERFRAMRPMNDMLFLGWGK